jgi:serine phosphatase RsbU (regulator of sigma subunit)/pSer/pThr/pTyr-binding forkhead associated (FHA) protein
MANEKAPTLILVEPSGARRPIPVHHTPLSIGRRPESDVHLRDSRVSRQHAIIRAEDGHYLIEDCRSRHGTWVNGERIDEPRELQPNDRIDFGVPDSYALIFVTEEESLAEILQRVDTPPSPDAVSQQLRKLNLFLEVGRTLHAGLALNEVLTLVIDTCLDITGSERGFLLTPDPRGKLECRVGRTSGRQTLTCEEADLSLPVIEQVLDRGREVLVDRVRPLGRLVGREARQAPQPAVICLPLHRAPAVASLDTTDAGTPANILGVIYLDNQRSSQPFAKLDRQILRSLAQEAATLIENANLFSAARAKERLDQELAIARTIQQRLLPREPRPSTFLQLAYLSIPCREVGGDYYDVIELPDRRLALVIADVCGKGVSAALLSATLQGALEAGLQWGQGVAGVAHQLNHYLRQHTESNIFATVFCGVLGPDGRFEFVNAGHVPPFWLHGERVEALSAENVPLGLYEREAYRARQIQLTPGDLLVLYTDGIMDATNSRGETYGRERLKLVAASFRQDSLTSLSHAVLKDVRDFTQDAFQEDDISLVLARFGPTKPGKPRDPDGTGA